MKFSLEIEMDNAAFDTNPIEALAFMVNQLHTSLHNTGLSAEYLSERGPVPVRDINGQTVGSFEISGTRPSDDEKITTVYILNARTGEGIDNNVDFFDVDERFGVSDAITDARREVESLIESDLEDMTDEERALDSHNGPRYKIVTYAKGGDLVDVT